MKTLTMPFNPPFLLAFSLFSPYFILADDPMFKGLGLEQHSGSKENKMDHILMV